MNIQIHITYGLNESVHFVRRYGSIFQIMSQLLAPCAILFSGFMEARGVLERLYTCIVYLLELNKAEAIPIHHPVNLG
jgi:hypothetical protein